MASYTTGDFLRLVSESGARAYKYPAVTIYPTITVGVAILAGSYNSPNTANIYFFYIVRVGP